MAKVESIILDVAILTFAALTTLSMLTLISASLGRTKAPRRRPLKLTPDKADFVIVTRASKRVLPTLLRTITNVRKMFPAYKLWVVVDEGSQGLHVLEVASKRLGFDLVVVPTSYERGKYKARAMNYFIEHVVADDKWYIFLDDDSYPLDDNFLYEIDEGVPVYNGILAPRRGGNLLSWIADASRYYSDLTKQGLALRVLRKPIYGLHGELLIVRGWVLKMIGFNTDSITEDSWFAAKLISYGIPVGQVSTRVSILSPIRLRDFVKQRARWLAGRLRDFIRGEYPIIMDLAYVQELTMMLLLIAAPFLGIFKAISNVTVNPAIARLGYLMGMLGGLLAILSYTSYHIIERRDAATALLAVLLIPAVAAIEAFSIVYGLAKYKTYSRRFVVIDKTVERHARRPRKARTPAAPRPPLRTRLALAQKVLAYGGLHESIVADAIASIYAQRARTA